jgi:hypothetical protein
MIRGSASLMGAPLWDRTEASLGLGALTLLSYPSVPLFSSPFDGMKCRDHRRRAHSRSRTLTRSEGRLISCLVQTEVTPTIVAGVCDPGIPTATGLTEAGYNACPIVARAEAPECYPKTSVFEPCLISCPF